MRWENIQEALEEKSIVRMQGMSRIIPRFSAKGTEYKIMPSKNILKEELFKIGGCGFNDIAAVFLFVLFVLFVFCFVF